MLHSSFLSFFRCFGSALEREKINYSLHTHTTQLVRRETTRQLTSTPEGAGAAHTKHKEGERLFDIVVDNST